jgi:outer membrane protein assembly factor BamB
MTNKVRLPLNSPVALHSGAKGIWVADRESRSIVCFEPRSAKQITAITVSEPPVAVAAADGFVAAALSSSVIAAFDEGNGAELWRRAAGSANVEMKGGVGRVWAAERHGAAVLSFDRAGVEGRVPSDGLLSFSPREHDVFWLSRDGVLVAYDAADRDTRTVPLPEALTAGAIAACANAIWVSVVKGLVILDQRSLQVRAALEAPEGPVPHLLCEDGKLVGGDKGVFVLNPMSDARVHPLPVHPASPLRGIAATPSIVWALESAEPVVHITDLV